MICLYCVIPVLPLHLLINVSAEANAYYLLASNILTCFPQLTFFFSASAEPPEFVVKLPTAKFVKHGESLRLECKVSGSAPLNVTWYKHDSKVTDGANIKTSLVDSLSVLELLSTDFDDDGVYTCEVQNDAGSISCSTTLSVKGQRPINWSATIVHGLILDPGSGTLSFIFMNLKLEYVTVQFFSLSMKSW